METEITIEIFNKCAGSCTGCMLSILERQSPYPVMPINTFTQCLDNLIQYGENIGTVYRPVFVFGDFPAMEVELQDKYLKAISDRGLRFGSTLTMVEKNRDSHYLNSVEAILKIDDTAILDFTIDPFRMLKEQAYCELIKSSIDMSKKYHAQVLLSEAILERFSPQSLSNLIVEKFGDIPVTLVFTPTLSNLDRKNYAYSVESAADFCSQFFEQTEGLKAHYKEELRRFGGHGQFEDFARHAFHVGADGSIYGVGYTIFGDVILDKRNGGKPIANLLDTDLSDIGTLPTIQKNSKLNDVYMNTGDFDCESCVFYGTCKFNGIGLIRKAYKDFEAKTGSCYGPKSMRHFYLS